MVQKVKMLSEEANKLTKLENICSEQQAMIDLLQQAVREERQRSTKLANYRPKAHPQTKLPPVSPVLQGPQTSKLLVAQKSLQSFDLQQHFSSTPKHPSG